MEAGVNGRHGVYVRRHAVEATPTGHESVILRHLRKVVHLVLEQSKNVKCAITLNAQVIYPFLLRTNACAPVRKRSKPYTKFFPAFC